MTKKLFVLQKITDFASGAFDNTLVESMGIQLARGIHGYMQSGSYTSPPISAPLFTELVPSWNVDAPEGTTIEMKVRVAAKGNWSEWFSFGEWSPYILRASPEPHGDDFAQSNAEVLNILQGHPPADTFQMRVLLKTQNNSISPIIRLLAVTINAEEEEEKRDVPYERLLEVPAYSSLVRAPAIADRIASATTLAMLMNVHGEDVLPEEVARSGYDSGAGRYSNLSFLCAAAGVRGYECYICYMGMEALRREVWLGNAVGAKVHYRAPVISGNEEKESDLPILEEAAADSSGHLVAVCGFEMVNGDTWVCFNDPVNNSNVAVRRTVPFSKFERMYTGICLILHRKPKGAGWSKPVRELAEMSFDQDEIRMSSRKGVPLIPGMFTREAYSRSTLCYTLAGSTAYASAAQRKFFYPTPDEEGVLRFDMAGQQGRRMTFYRIGPYGNTTVGEKTIPEEPGEE